MTSPFRIFKIVGHSMEPTLMQNSYVLVWTWARRYRPTDIIIFRHDGTIYSKRIIESTEQGFIVHGDNKKNSHDSTDFGRIPRSSIIGKIIWF